MIIALLVILGVDLIVIVVVASAMVGRRRWLKRQTGSFAGAIRVVGGDVGGLKAKWSHGSGRWVRDVLVWSKSPDLFRSAIVPIDALVREPKVLDQRIRRVGAKPLVLTFSSDDASIEMAVKAGDQALASGSLGEEQSAHVGMGARKPSHDGDEDAR